MLIFRNYASLGLWKYKRLKQPKVLIVLRLANHHVQKRIFRTLSNILKSAVNIFTIFTFLSVKQWFETLMNVFLGFVYKFVSLLERIILIKFMLIKTLFKVVSCI